MSIFTKFKAWFFKEEKRVLETFNDILELEKAAEEKVVDVVDAVEEKVEVVKVELKKVNDQITDSVTQIAQTKPKRARSAKGKFKADDKATPVVNEAWVGGKAPEKKSRKPRAKKNG